MAAGALSAPPNVVEALERLRRRFLSVHPHGAALVGVLREAVAPLAVALDALLRLTEADPPGDVAACACRPAASGTLSSASRPAALPRRGGARVIRRRVDPPIFSRPRHPFHA